MEVGLHPTGQIETGTREKHVALPSLTTTLRRVVVEHLAVDEFYINECVNTCIKCI